MRISFVSQARFPSRTAESIHVVKMCSAFAALGHDVTLVCPRYSSESMDASTLLGYYGAAVPFRVTKLRGITLKSGRRIFGVRTALHLRRHSADLAYVRNLQAAYFCAAAGVPVVYEVHTPLKHAGRLSRWMQARLFASPNLVRVVCISDALRAHYGSEHGLAPETLKVVREAAEPDVPGETTAAVNPRSGDFRVAYVGQLYPGKGMEVVADLARACPWAQFDVVGGEEADIRAWQARCSDLGNLFFHGFVPHARTGEFRRSADVLLAPYQRSVGDSSGGDIAQWMSPMKVFEYMAAGGAIIASDLPVIREVLEDGSTALLCPPDDPGAWAAALTRLRDDAELRRALGERALEDFSRNYTWEKRAASVLEGLGNGRGPASSPRSTGSVVP